MNFSKAKIIIIACLFVVNIVLGVFCISIKTEKSYISQEEAELASTHLARQGIGVVFDSDYRKIYNLPIYLVDTVNREDKVPDLYRSFTEAFFGVPVDSTEYVNTPDGYIVSVKDEGGNSIGTSSLGKELEIECYFDAYFNENDIETMSSHSIECGLRDISDSDNVDIARKFLESALKSDIYLYSLTSKKSHLGGTLMCFSRKLEKTEVLDIYINVFVKDARVLYCYARAYDNQPVKAYSADLIDCVDAMYVFSEMMKERQSGDNTEIIIDDISMVYKMIEYVDGDYYIVPAWLIEYNNSKGEKFCAGFDAIIGENRFLLQQ